MAGCQVDTSVSVTSAADGTGDVAVKVTFDEAAVSALGGAAAVQSELDYSDLQSAGWRVVPPRAASGGGVVVQADHPFSSPEQAGALLGEIAGTGPASERPFRLQLVHKRSFWHTSTSLSGTIDLRCGLGCFGDPGLQSALGSATGIDPATLGVHSTAQAAQTFRFSFAATLPGHPHSTNGQSVVAPTSGTASTATPPSVAPAVGSSQTGSAPGAAGGQPQTQTQTQQWTPVLGQVTEINYVTQGWNSSSIRLLVAVAAVVVLAIISIGVWLLIRRRRKKRARRAATRANLYRIGRMTIPEDLDDLDLSGIADVPGIGDDLDSADVELTVRAGPIPPVAAPSVSDAGGAPLAARPFVGGPVLVEPPAADIVAAGDGLGEAPVVANPVTEPAATDPALVETPVTGPAVSEPSATQPAVTQPPVTQPPVTAPAEPAVTAPAEPAVSEPAEPAATESALFETPVTEPAVTAPRVTGPPVTETSAAQLPGPGSPSGGAESEPDRGDAGEPPPSGPDGAVTPST